MFMRWALVAMLAVATSACSAQTSQDAPSTVTVTASGTSATQSTESAPTSSKAETFQATLLPVQETHGTTSVNVQLPQVTGGPDAVRERFNNGMRATLDDMIRPDFDVTIDDGELAGGERSRVTTITPKVLAGVAIFNWYGKGAVHPNNSVATIATNVDTAAPILLADVFSDQQAAAERLTASATEINPDVAPLTPPSIDNFLNWVPLPEGFHVYVPVSHAMGDYFPVTVPWDRVSDLMTPAMRTALIP